jgi:hypothetical protein
MSEPKKFGMHISQILDKTTVVVAGEGVERLSVGDSLLILAIGTPLPGIGVPLVVKKADLEVDSVTQYYAVARTPEYDVVVQDSVATIASVFGPKKIRKRDQLRVDESILMGNPAAGPVRIDDPVVEEGELSEYVEMLAAKYR